MKNLYDYERTQSATTDLPFGALKNESSPGKQDGTDIVAEHIQDLAYSLYQVLQLAGINPNGELEDGNNKTQFIESLTNIGVFRYSDKTSYNYGVFAWQVIGNTFTLYRSLKNSNSDDVNNNESWLKILEIGADNKINFNVDTNILGLSANPSLSNLSEVGEDRLNVSKMYETGAVSNDTKGFKELLKRAHSTFDKSKFEVVGSPTITDDGIASGFSDSNYIRKSSLELNGNWVIRGNLKTFNTQTNSNRIIEGKNLSNNTTEGVTLLITAQNKIAWSFTANGVVIVPTTTSSYVVDNNVDYYYSLSYNNGVFNLAISKDNINFTNISTISATITESVIFDLFFCKSSNTAERYLDGSIDLKYFSVLVNGIPVFNGNKTGLDIVKPDNFEIVGSPNIAEDGIASGFSNSNYLIKTLNTNFLNSNFDLIIPVGVTNAGSDSGNAITLMNGTAMVARAYLASDGYLFSLYYKDRTVVVNGANLIPKANLTSNAINYIRITRVDNKINCYGYYNNKWNLRTSPTIPDGQSFDENIDIYIGAQRNGENALSTYVDLNLIKFSSNNSLIYQPCLKIPYTETFEHPNVVDVAYRDRVQDLYEQTGEALFYTIDEQNQNFTLPAGDIYGMITKNREILDIVYPIGRPMPEENNVLLDNEVWLEGATVNIVDYPKLFKIYGTKYGGDGTTTFKLPDLRNRVLWGSSDGSNGYIESKLPNIKGDFILGGDGGTHPQTGSSAASGAYQFTSTSSGATFENTGAGQTRYDNLNFNASRSNSIYSDSAKIVQPPAFKVRWKTRFE